MPTGLAVHATRWAARRVRRFTGGTKALDEEATSPMAHQRLRCKEALRASNQGKATSTVEYEQNVQHAAHTDLCVSVGRRL